MKDFLQGDKETTAGDGEGREELAIKQLAIKRMLVSGIFKQLRTFVVVPDVLSKFSKIENLFFFRGSVRCQHQLKLYSFERD